MQRFDIQHETNARIAAPFGIKHAEQVIVTSPLAHDLSTLGRIDHRFKDNACVVVKGTNQAQVNNNRWNISTLRFLLI